MPQLPPDLLAELNQAIEARHLQMVGGAIRDNSAACHALVATGEDDYSSVGNTRFGGDPDLPAGVDWPTDATSTEPRYSNFIAQINFADLPRLPGDDVLPKSGLLYLFVREMFSAEDPVYLDAIFFEGDLSALARRPSPPENALCDEYLVDLIPQRIEAIPAVSIADYRKPYRHHIEENTSEINGEDGYLRSIHLGSDLRRSEQIGQILGYANAGDIRENLYRQVVLGRLGKRSLIYSDYWDSMAAYEESIKRATHPQEVQQYERMRDGVAWLSSNREMVSDLVYQWRLLLRLDSNDEMNLLINDFDPLYVFIRHEDLANRDFSNLAAEVTQG